MHGRCISDDEARGFERDGFLVLRGVLQGEELSMMRRACDDLLQYGSQQVRDHPDFMYKPGHRTGKPVLHRIEYVIDKADAAKVLLGNPFILRSVEKIMGRDLIPTWDSMVIKMPGEGIVVPWHRDAGVEQQGDAPIFNVDFYMDDADMDTCLWVYPGSHLWPAEEIRKVTSQPGFSTDGALPVPMKAGDVIFHNILLLHGSPPNASGKLRRVVYYEFRTAATERDIGPHVPAYIPLKQRVLMSCLEKRAQAPYVRDAEPYTYSPPPEFAFGWTPGEALDTYRYAHADYWRG